MERWAWHGKQLVAHGLRKELVAGVTDERWQQAEQRIQTHFWERERGRGREREREKLHSTCTRTFTRVHVHTTYMYMYAWEECMHGMYKHITNLIHVYMLLLPLTIAI